MLYGVVMHDYMLDMLKTEFIMVYGKTKEEAANNAWDRLKSEIDDLIKDLKNDNGKAITRKKFIKDVIDNMDSNDAVFISRPYYLYVKMFEIPNE